MSSPERGRETQHARLLEQPAGSMCNCQVRLTGPSEVDGELIAWIRKAYEAAG